MTLELAKKVCLTQQKYPSLTEVYDAVVLLTEEQFPMGVRSTDIKDALFPDMPIHRLCTKLHRLYEKGQLERVVDKSRHMRGVAYLYTPAPVKEEPRKIPAPTTEDQKREKRRILAEECEVCQALIGVKASDGMSLVTCNTCDSDYLVKDGYLYRLTGNPIKLKIWTPE